MSGERALEAFYGALLDDDPELLYDRAPCGYLSTAPDGTITKVNQTFLTLTGYRRDDLVGRKRFVDLLTGGGRIYHETHYAPMLQMEGQAHEIALDLRRPDGARIPVLVNAVLERDAAGEPCVIRTAVFDASHRREYERALLDAKRRAEAAEERATQLARTLQSTLIPLSPPVVPGLDVGTRYHPAGHGSEVGGDFFDLFETAAEEWVVTIGDVCGKGVHAAVATAMARSTVRAASVRPTTPSSTLEVLNEVLLRHDPSRFVTALVAHLRPTGDGWDVTLACGGHPLPLLADGRTVHTVGRPGSLLGMLPTVNVADSTFHLGAGEALVLYTDGVEEARRDREFYGEERLSEVLAAARSESTSADHIASTVLDDVLGFQDGLARDDVALVVLVPRQPGSAVN
jgi:sigma-B regulation protein RsbU (phosphoserine phosphatase)